MSSAHPRPVIINGVKDRCVSEACVRWGLDRKTITKKLKAGCRCYKGFTLAYGDEPVLGVDCQMAPGLYAWMLRKDHLRRGGALLPRLEMSP